jgi:hypothetical protein
MCLVPIFCHIYVEKPGGKDQLEKNQNNLYSDALMAHHVDRNQKNLYSDALMAHHPGPSLSTTISLQHSICGRSIRIERTRPLDSSSN